MSQPSSPEARTHALFPSQVYLEMNKEICGDIWTRGELRNPARLYDRDGTRAREKAN